MGPNNAQWFHENVLMLCAQEYLDSEQRTGIGSSVLAIATLEQLYTDIGNREGIVGRQYFRNRVIKCTPPAVIKHSEQKASGKPFPLKT